MKYKIVILNDKGDRIYCSRTGDAAVEKLINICESSNPEGVYMDDKLWTLVFVIFFVGLVVGVAIW
jgi:hypothetical protein